MLASWSRFALVAVVALFSACSSGGGEQLSPSVDHAMPEVQVSHGEPSRPLREMVLGG
jgi:hypothetical protein